MNHFIVIRDRVKSNSVFYRDRDAIEFEKKHWDKLDKTVLFGEELGQGKNDFSSSLRGKYIYFRYTPLFCQKAPITTTQI